MDPRPSTTKSDVLLRIALFPVFASIATASVVTTDRDEDNGLLGGGFGVSLREAVKYSPAATIITFSADLYGETIDLTHPDGDLIVLQDITIDATSLPGGLVLHANSTSRHFDVPAGRALTLRGLTLSGGNGQGDNFLLQGGSVYNAGTLTLTNCTFSRNTSGTRTGGAVYNNLGTVSLTNCTFCDNTASRGGAIYNGGTLSLTSCALAGNTALTAGGAIYNGGTLSLTNCTIAGNTSSTGGAIYNLGSLLMGNCTLADNTASTSGGGISSTFTVTVSNTVVAQNEAPSGKDISSTGIITPSGVNFMGSLSGSGLSAGPSLMVGVARLSALGYFGGRVQTMHPLLGSPLIDSAGTTSPGGTDARGLPRLNDGDANGTTALDIGAVEAGPLLSVSTLADSTHPASLRSRVAESASSPGARISFSPHIFPATIVLDSGEIFVPPNPGLFFDASNLSGPVIISGNNKGRIFSIPAATTVAMHSLKIMHGRAPDGPYGGNGGGILNAGSLSLFSCTISGNQAGTGGTDTHLGVGGIGGGYGGGGGGISSTGPLLLNSCTVSGNAAGIGGQGTNFSGSGGYGGGIYCIGRLALTNCTLFGNISGNAGDTISTTGERGCGGNGGAIYQTNGTCQLTSCTIAGNRTGTGFDDGTGYCRVGSGSGVQSELTIITDCIFADNQPVTGGWFDDVRAGPLSFTGKNILRNVSNGLAGCSGSVPIYGDPMLAPLGDYGGPTETMPLRAGSPARNAAVGTKITSDQRGFPAVGARDLGAYEAGNVLAGNYESFIWESLPLTATPPQAVRTYDFDGDGNSNELEWLADTSPVDPNSTFRPVGTLNGTTFTVTIPTIAGRNYILQLSDTLAPGTWSDVTAIGGNDSIQHLRAPALAPRGYFRVKITAQ